MIEMRNEVVGMVASLSVAVAAVVWASASASASAQQMLVRRRGREKPERYMIASLGSGACSDNGFLIEAEQSWTVGGSLGR
jgi:hypothetical protein